MTVATALNELSRAFVSRPVYAHTWHCNIACVAMDEGVDHAAAQRIATRFMRLAFHVHTENDPHGCGQPYESINETT